MIHKQLVKEVRRAPALFIVTVLGAVLSAAAVLLECWAFANIIDGAFLRQQSLADLSVWLWVALAAIVARFAFAWLEEYSALRLAAIVQTDMRTALIDACDQLGPVALTRHQSGTLLHVLFDGVDTLEKYFSGYLPQLLKALMVPLLFLVVVLPKDALSSLLMLLTIPLIPFFMILIGTWTRNASVRQWQLITQLSGFLQDVLCGLETLMVLGRSKAQGEKISGISEQYRKTTLQVQKWAFVSSLALELLSTLSIAVIAVGLGVRLVHGEIDYLAAFFILLLAPEYYQPMRSLGSYFHASLDAEEAANSIYAFLDEAAQAPRAVGDVNDGATAFESLTFEQVSYRYPGSRVDALHDVSFTIQAGERVALTGASGSGKSTLIQLVLGFLQPTAGRILVNGVPLEAQSMSAWQARISYVSQKPYVFMGTVYENIAFRTTLSEHDKMQMDVIAEQIGLLDLLSDLPLGLETRIGQGGQSLSGGQQDVMMLARALYDARPLVCLDEVTDNLDLLTESHVVTALEQLLADRSSLTIAHRLSTIREADRILVFEAGQLVDSGTFDALLTRRGVFQQLAGRS